MTGVKRRAFVFPERGEKQDTAMGNVSSRMIRAICNPIGQAADFLGGMVRYVENRTRTEEIRKQTEIGKRAVDAYYQEKEERERIYVTEELKRMEAEFRKKCEWYQMQLKAAEMEAERCMREKEIAFAEYLKTSQLYDAIFKALQNSLRELENALNVSKPLVNNTSYYVELAEQYRILVEGIKKYAVWMV